MQAIILFTIFGAFMATVAGIISSGSETVRQITLNRVEQANSFFSQAEDIFKNRITYQDMEIAPTSQCNGSSTNPAGGLYTVNDPQPYLCRTEVRQLAAWDMTGVYNAAGAVTGVRITDPWRNDIQGVVVRRDMSIGPGVKAPVTAMAIISAGPDRKLSPNLEAALHSVRTQAGSGSVSAAVFRNVLQLGVEADRNAGIKTDDIVHTFSNLTAQQDRWNEVSANVDNIMVGMQESYLKQYENFKPTLQAYYLNNPGLAISSPYSWKALPLANMPSLAIPNLNSTDSVTGRPALGLDEEFSQITSAAPNGSGLSLRHVWGSTNAVPGATDIDSLTIIIGNASSPWTTVNYRKNMTMAPAIP